ncbi:MULTISPECIES: RNA polymerase sigma factor [Paracoccaceae]|uniref:RNA polymerase sigma factor n=1 Tax=Rhodobacterales TaxID=204455 RepID=UPI001B110EF9|nr:sigma-70 family RNA polymerase sigma factor [Boseongicola sp. H5]MBO6626337.1 sigma-70 family RNA polymerase sigma factor [Roseicyclus sp.]MBO6920992.1 sigma-70 family RNA polymerase sigma factor [Roseicyclus sp.]
MTEDQTQAALLTRMADGDRQALAALYRALEKPVFRFIRSRLNDPFEAGDILHDVFMEVWRSAGRFEGRSKVQTWIFGIAYRKVIDAHRKRGRTDLVGDVPDSADEGPDAETCLAAGQEAEHVRHCLGTLKDDHRAAISMAFYDDMTYGEIAEIAGVPEGTIKTRIFHAKKLLMRCLSGRVARRAPA